MKLTSILMSSIIAMIAVLPVASVLAADSYWGSSTGNFSDGSSWESGGVPGVGDNANFANGATYDVTFTADAECENANFSAPSGEVTIDPDDYEWILNGGLTVADTVRLILAKGGLTTSGDNTITTANSSPENMFTLGNGNAGDVFIWNITGGVTTITTPGTAGDPGPALYLGNQNQRGDGIMNISGASTIVSNSTDVFIGRYTWSSQQNSLTVSNGASFYNGNRIFVGRSCAYNDLVVTGNDSFLHADSDIILGKSGADSTVTVSDGARLESDGSLYAGSENGDRSKLLVTGAGTELECSDFRFANTGSDDCSVVVSNGASVVVNGYFSIGDSGVKDAHDNTITVVGEGTVLTQTVGNVLWTGFTNSMYVLDGATVWLNQLSGTLPGSTNGTLVVSGIDTSMSVYRLYANDNQTVAVSNGASFTVRDGMYLGYPGDPGYVKVTGSNSSFSVVGNVPCRLGNSAGGTTYFTLSDGAQFEHNNVGGWDTTVGYQGHGILTVTGEGTKFAANQADLLRVGYRTGSVAEITVKDKALLSCNSTMFGDSVGSTGTVTIVGSGVWTNTSNVIMGGYSDDGATKATLAFVLDEDGVSTVHIGGTLTVRPTESYLSVDLSDYDLDEATDFVLVDCGTLSGTFDEDKISVTGLNGGSIVQDTDNDQIILHVNGQRGTVILIQ